MSLFGVQTKLNKIIAVTSENLQGVVKRCQGLNELDQTSAEQAYDSNRLHLSINQLYQSTQQRRSVLLDAFDTVSSSVWMMYELLRSVAHGQSINQSNDQNLRFITAHQSISCQVMDPNYVQVSDDTLSDRPFMDVAMKLLITPTERNPSTVEFVDLSKKQKSNGQSIEPPSINVKISFLVEFDDVGHIDEYRTVNQSIKPVARVRFIQLVRTILCEENQSDQHLAVVSLVSMNEPIKAPVDDSGSQSQSASCIQVTNQSIKQPIKQMVCLLFESHVIANSVTNNIPHAYKLALKCLQSINQAKSPIHLNSDMRIPCQSDTLIVNILHRELQFAQTAVKRAYQQSINQSVIPPKSLKLPPLPMRPSINLDSPQLANWFGYETEVSQFVEQLWDRIADPSIDLRSPDNAYHYQYIQSIFTPLTTCMRAVIDLEMQADHVKDQTRSILSQHAAKLKRDAEALQANWKQFNRSYAVLHDRLKQRWVKLLAHNCGIVTVPKLPEEQEIATSKDDPSVVKIRGKEAFDQEIALLEMVMNDCITQYNCSRTAAIQLDPESVDDYDENFPAVYLKAISDLKAKLDEEQQVYGPGALGKSLQQTLRRDYFSPSSSR